jgi:hypothetical protein
LLPTYIETRVLSVLEGIAEKVTNCDVRDFE